MATKTPKATPKKATKPAKKSAPAPRKKRVKAKTGRKCSVCSHENAADINSQIATGASFRSIALQYGMAHSSASRHAEKCLNLEIQALIAAKKIENAINHYDEISEQLAFAKRLRLACAEYLSDPDDPDRIVLLPRSDEVDVIYDDYKDMTARGEPRRKKDSLSTLLERVEAIPDGGGIAVVAKQTIIKHVDLRSFAVDCIRAVDLVLDKVAKVDGLYQQDRENKEKLTRTIKAINDYLELHPQADRTKVIDAFSAGRGIPKDVIQEHMGLIG